MDEGRGERQRVFPEFYNWAKTAREAGYHGALTGMSE
jgi:hypothetical protein